jgi:hypothetical protein
MAMEAKAPEVEMYPDEVPKTGLSFVVPMINPENDLGKFSYVFKSILSKKKWYPVFWQLERTENCSDYIFKKSHDKTTENPFYAYVHFQYGEAEQKVSFNTSAKAFNSYAWDIIQKKQGENKLVEDEAYVLSWKYINMTIHKRFIYHETLNKNQWGEEDKLLFNTIKNKGLQDSMYRVSILVNKENNLLFSSHFNTENEEKRCNNLIEDLQKK